MANFTASVPITIRGRYLWKGDERFFVRGVVYQVPDSQDPISDARLPQLRHDIPLFKELGLNTIYVYFVDNTKRHGQAMKLLEEAGIYVITGIASRFHVIKRLDPYGSYHRDAVEDFFETVSMMSNYTNTLGLFIASNLVNDRNTEKAAPVAKAVVRDLKRYTKHQFEAHHRRILPIGYDAATTDNRDKTLLDYLSLGDPTSSIDFWACTCYTWAGESDMLTSSYNALITRLQAAALPIIISEYGTNIPNPRLFQETAALYSPRMSQVFSGGCAYEFWESANGYGLVELLEQEHSPDTPAWAVAQNRTRALARSKNRRKTAEKREMERGTLSVFFDFVNYKDNLDASRGIDRDWEGDVMEREAVARGAVDTAQMSWPWEPEFRIPDTVVDWEVLARGDLTYVM